MKALQIRKHKTNLTNLLLDIYKDGNLGSLLGFKGGTAAMLFYDLPRFSTDLDFDLVLDLDQDSSEYKYLLENISDILSSRGEIKDHSYKYNTLFWLFDYGSGYTNIKVEISTRDNSYNKYQIKELYGIRVRTIEVGGMIAHKLVAIQERPVLANRDLFDAHYFLNSKYVTSIDNNVIKIRTGLSPKDFYISLLLFINTVKPDSILSGLGEVLGDGQKDWAKAKLIEELKSSIKLMIDIS